MKIAVSSVGGDLSSMLDARFGRCRCFVIYDTKKGTLNAVYNDGQSAGSGAGIAAAQKIIDLDVEAVITGNIGPNAFNLFKDSDIKVYQCSEIEVESALKLFAEGKLPEIRQISPASSGKGLNFRRGFRD